MNMSRRNLVLQEKMEDPDCDPVQLAATYRQFAWMNRLVSGWIRIYRQWLRPVFRTASKPVSLLDAGCGGGDIAKRIMHWAQRDGFDLSILGLDADPRAIAFAREHNAHARIAYRTDTLTHVEDEGLLFDVVLSNHVLHHLSDEETAHFLASTERLATRLALHSDIRRSPVAYGLFKYCMPLLFHGSFTVEDGLTSIRKSYSPDEIASRLPAGWQVRTMFPWRLIVAKESENDANGLHGA